MRIPFLLFVTLFCSKCIVAQGDSLLLNFQFQIMEHNLVLNEVYKLNSADSFEINTLKCYISSVELLLDDKTIWSEEGSFHLIDATDENSNKIFLKVSNGIRYDKLRFKMGIDSLTNISGAMGGDLDPTKGMYWTWQSGYVNFKLEGNSNLCMTRKNEFKFHLGGYQFPNNCLQTITLKTTSDKVIPINVDLTQLVSVEALSGHSLIMSPCAEAVRLSKLIAAHCSIQLR